MTAACRHPVNAGNALFITKTGDKKFSVLHNRSLIDSVRRYIPDLRTERVEPHHKHPELFFRDLRSFFRGPWPAHRAVFEPAVKHEEPVAAPEQGLTAVCPASAEKEQGPFFERVLSVAASDDLCEAVHTFAKVDVAALSLCGDKQDYPHRIIILIFSKTVYFARLSKEKMRITY